VTNQDLSTDSKGSLIHAKVAFQEYASFPTFW